MSDLGDRLKRARESRGLSLQDVAVATKISVVALGAIERQDFARVPGGIFGRAFVRSYAMAVGLEPEAAAAEYQEARARFDREAETEVLRPQVTADDQKFLERQQRAIRSLRWGLIAAAIVGAGLLVYELWAWWPRPAPTVVTSPPPAEPPQAEPAPREAPAPTAAPPPAVTTAPVREGGPMVFEFTATSACWLRLTVDGSVVLDRELQAGETRRVEAVRELQLHTGSVGALAWTINGQAARPLGDAGRTARATVTPDTLRKFIQQN